MKSTLKITGMILLVLISVSGAGASYYWYIQYQKIVANPQSGSAEEVKMLVKKLSAFMELPQETPSVVTISDRDKLQNQQFFQKAKNGDKIVIFEAAKRIILYRPETNRIIDVAPLVFSAPTQDTQQLVPQTNPSPVLNLEPMSTDSATETATPSAGYKKFMPAPEAQ